MSYPLDRKARRKGWKRGAAIAVVLVLLVCFRAGIFRVLSAAVHAAARPVLSVGRDIGNNFSRLGSAFRSKSSLSAENAALESKIAENAAFLANYQSLLAENESLKNSLGRSGESESLVAAAVLAKPNSSPYDTLVIDAGTRQGLAAGDRVYAYGSVPIGRVAEVFASSATVVLYSSPGEKTQATVLPENVSMQLVGRGGGNFEMILPRDFTVSPGAEVDLPGITPRAVATVATVISDPRDAFIKALLVSPVNIQELGYVEVAK